MIPANKDVIFYNAQYSMMEYYLNDVVVKELTWDRLSLVGLGHKKIGEIRSLVISKFPCPSRPRGQ